MNSNILQRIVDYIKVSRKDEFKRFSSDSFELSRKKPLRSLTKTFIDNFSLICEIKKASPSAGILCKDFNPETRVQQYIKGGADAISVLTEKKFFHASDHDFKTVRLNTDLPVLRKDFIIHIMQLYESYNMGADAILLICRILTPSEFRSLVIKAHELGLEVIAETRNRAEIETAVSNNADIIGINNRNLKTFNIDLNISERLIKYIPDNYPVISESGIRSADELNFLKELKFNGALIGSTLMKEKNPEAIIRRFKNAN